MTSSPRLPPDHSRPRNPEDLKPPWQKTLDKNVPEEHLSRWRGCEVDDKLVTITRGRLRKADRGPLCRHVYLTLPTTLRRRRCWDLTWCMRNLKHRENKSLHRGPQLGRGQAAFRLTQSGSQRCLPNHGRRPPRPSQASVGLRGGSGRSLCAASALASPSGQLATLWSSPILGSTSSTQGVPPLLAWKLPTQ